MIAEVQVIVEVLLIVEVQVIVEVLLIVEVLASSSILSNVSQMFSDFLQSSRLFEKNGDKIMVFKTVLRS